MLILFFHLQQVILFVFKLYWLTSSSSLQLEIASNQEEIENIHSMHPDSRIKRIVTTKSINVTELNSLTSSEKLTSNKRLPASIEVKLGSMLFAEPGKTAIIMFEVTNNRYFTTEFYFNIQDNYNYIRRFFPVRAPVTSGSTVLVQAELLVQANRERDQSSPDIVTLVAAWRPLSGNFESVIKKTYLYIQNQQLDSTQPYIWYDYASDCAGALTPQNCHTKTWKVDVTVQDSTSGLLSFRSNPVGLILKKEFIVGTRDQVLGYYSENCCHTKVDIIAMDTLGNIASKTIDIEKKWLSTGEISAVVLGCILLLIIIILIIVGIIACIKKKKRTLNIYPDHRLSE